MDGRITSTQNDFVKFVKSLKSKKGRKEHDVFVVESEKCVSELFAYKPELIRDVVVIEDAYSDIIDSARRMGKRIHTVTEHVMRAVCDSKTPQGIAVIAKTPEYEHVYDGFVLALDDVADPQNVGTMIRTADAAGCACVVLTKESADCYSPKAVRASMGSIFHLPVIRANLAEYISNLKENGYHIVSAHLKGSDEYDFDWRKTCLVIGNESRGVSEDILDMSGHLVKIPMFGKAESLNASVAAGILIYKIRT